MSISNLQPGIVYTGRILSRSSDLPGRDHTYGVEIPYARITFDGVPVQRQTRWTNFEDTLDVWPFPVGTRVSVHIDATPQGLQAVIESTELPVAGECQ